MFASLYRRWLEKRLATIKKQMESVREICLRTSDEISLELEFRVELESSFAASNYRGLPPSEILPTLEAKHYAHIVKLKRLMREEAAFQTRLNSLNVRENFSLFIVG